ncbi:MAG: adenylate/guanylate cyclase domain-containing protein, partial [Beijerinckiaceae bacterium]
QVAIDPTSCRMRLGLHTGRVVAGDLGFAGRIDYTVVGRTVNIAQRCQAAIKGHCDGAPVGLGITEALRVALKLPLASLEPVAELRGGEQAYRVVSIEGAQTSVIPSRAISAEGQTA